MEYNEQRKYALKLFKGKQYDELRKAIKEQQCFKELLLIAEKCGAIILWDDFLDEWKYYGGEYWKGITDAMRIQTFPTLSDEWKYWAGLHWKGITDAMRDGNKTTPLIKVS